MTTLEQLERWRSGGAISGKQYADLAAIVRKDRFPVFLELNALLYIGVLSFVAGVGLTVREHFASLGDAAIVVPLAALFAGCLWYCFGQARPYAPHEVASPGFVVDYVLYLGCLVFAIELGYLEFRFHVLREKWDLYLLAAAILYAGLAYRFDNRFVLSLALSTLAGWFGVRFSWHGFHLAGSMRGDAMAYAGVVAAIGWWTHRAGLKRHFFEAYLHVAVNAALAALVSGVVGGAPRQLWLAGLMGACGLAVDRGIRFRRFAFVVYGVLYGYVGISAEILRHLHGDTSTLAYVAASAGAVIALLVVVARRFGREE